MTWRFSAVLTCGLPAAATALTWYGGGPGEVYPDTCAAARIGRFTARVEDFRPPYLFQQENGSRTGVRWAGLHGGPAGGSLRVSGPEPFPLAVRPWSAAALDLAGHTMDLRPDGHLHPALDAAQHGIGSASCGPGVRPAHRLAAGPMSFAVEMLAG